MKITSINVRPVKTPPEEGLLARISMTVDNAISLKGMHLMRSKNGSIYLLMADQPRRNAPGEYEDLYHPITRECRQYMLDTVKETYEMALEEPDHQESYIYDLTGGTEQGSTLNITEIRIHRTKSPDARCKAFVAVVLDDEFVLHQMRLHPGKDGELFLAMPSFPRRAGEERSVNIYHPISTPVREKLVADVIAEYEKTEAEAKAEKDADAEAKTKAEAETKPDPEAA